MEISDLESPNIAVNIILVFGIPGAGKSHTSQKIKKRLTKDQHICFSLDYDLLEDYHPDRIMAAEEKGLLELFEQQTVYLYNSEGGENGIPKQIAVISKKGRKRASLFLFDKPEENFEEGCGNKPNSGDIKSRFFQISEGYPNPQPSTFIGDSTEEVQTKNIRMESSNDLNLDGDDQGKNMMLTKVDPTNFSHNRKFDAEKYRLVREIMPEKLERLVNYCKTLKKGKNKKIFMIIDDTMLRRSSRRKYLTLAREYRWGYQEVFVKVSLDEAKIWNKSRPINKQVDEKVIEKSLQQLDIVPNKYLIIWDKNDKKLETFEGKIIIPQQEKQAETNIDSFNSIMYDCMEKGVRTAINTILRGDFGSKEVAYLAEYEIKLGKLCRDKKAFSKQLMSEKKLFNEIIKSQVSKIFDLDRKMGSVCLFKTCQDLFGMATKGKKQIVTSMEDFNKFEKVSSNSLKPDDFNLEETNMDYESFVQIVGDIEEALESKIDEQIGTEQKIKLIEKCTELFGLWVVQKLSTTVN